jgi:hypothetical protein
VAALRVLGGMLRCWFSGAPSTALLRKRSFVADWCCSNGFPDAVLPNTYGLPMVK